MKITHAGYICIYLHFKMESFQGSCLICTDFHICWHVWRKSEQKHAWRQINLNILVHSNFSHYAFMPTFSMKAVHSFIHGTSYNWKAANMLHAELQYAATMTLNYHNLYGSLCTYNPAALGWKWLPRPQGHFDPGIAGVKKRVLITLYQSRHVLNMHLNTAAKILRRRSTFRHCRVLPCEKDIKQNCFDKPKGCIVFYFFSSRFYRVWRCCRRVPPFCQILRHIWSKGLDCLHECAEELLLISWPCHTEVFKMSHNIFSCMWYILCTVQHMKSLK